MGRIRQKYIKRLAKELIEKFEFTNNFEENKKIINKVLPDASKRFRNRVAGYITRKMRNVS